MTKPWFMRTRTIGDEVVVESCVDLNDGPEYSYPVDDDEPWFAECQVLHLNERIAALEAMLERAIRLVGNCSPSVAALVDFFDEARALLKGVK